MDSGCCPEVILGSELATAAGALSAVCWPCLLAPNPNGHVFGGLSAIGPGLRGVWAVGAVGTLGPHRAVDAH